jgi:hypothetical protein
MSQQRYFIGPPASRPPEIGTGAADYAIRAWMRRAMNWWEGLSEDERQAILAEEAREKEIHEAPQTPEGAVP